MSLKQTVRTDSSRLSLAVVTARASRQHALKKCAAFPYLDKIVTGSFQGMLRIYNPLAHGKSDATQHPYRIEHLMLEKDLKGLSFSLSLRVCAGRTHAADVISPP
jgi:hypothetical protein